METAVTFSSNVRGRALRRLRRLTLAVAGGSIAALATAAYVAAITIPGSTGATRSVAAVSSTGDTSSSSTTTTPSATPTPAPTASSKPVAVSGGSR